MQTDHSDKATGSGRLSFGHWSGSATALNMIDMTRVGPFGYDPADCDGDGRPAGDVGLDFGGGAGGLRWVGVG